MPAACSRRAGHSLPATRHLASAPTTADQLHLRGRVVGGAKGVRRDGSTTPVRAHSPGSRSRVATSPPVPGVCPCACTSTPPNHAGTTMYTPHSQGGHPRSGGTAPCSQFDGASALISIGKLVPQEESWRASVERTKAQRRRNSLQNADTQVAARPYAMPNKDLALIRECGREAARSNGQTGSKAS